MIDQIKQYFLNNMIWGENRREKNAPHILRQGSYDEQIEVSLLGLVMPDTSRVWGIDISHWNIPPVALKQMVDLYGLSFVIIKGCDGSIRSRYFADHVAAAQFAGIPYGFYDWLYPNSRVSIDAQVSAWVSQAQEYNPPMGISIDAEWTTYAGQSANPSATDLRSAHDKVAARYEPAKTYTAMGYANQYLVGFNFSDKDLWVASYGGSQPLMPNGANRWEFWQFTSELDGHQLDQTGNAELDGNYYNGTREQFISKYGGQNPPSGGNVWYRLNADSIHIRKGAGTNYQSLGYLLRDDKVEVFGDFIGNWAPIERIYRKNGVVEIIPDAWCSRSYLVSTTAPPITPPVDPPPVDPPPPPTPVPSSIDIQLAAGSTVTIKDQSGDVLWSGTA